MSFVQQFKRFINRGNVLDLAVAVVIGAAFGRITSSLTDDIITPLIGWLVGDLDFSNSFARLGPIPAGYAGSRTSYAELKAAGVQMLGYGEFLSTVINFLLIALVVFTLVRAVTRAMQAFAEEEAAKKAEAPDSPEVLLLRDIRDALRARGEGGQAGPVSR